MHSFDSMQDYNPQKYKSILTQYNILGIPLLFEKTKFDSTESKRIIRDILIINTDNKMHDNVHNFCNLFLLSMGTNSYVFIK